jgi:hypothetical protein
VRGYRDALKLIHEQGANLRLPEELILELRRLCMAGVGDAGHYKERDSDIIKMYADWRQRVQFGTVKLSTLRETCRRWWNTRTGLTSSIGFIR